MGDLSRMTLKELGIFFLYTACMLLMMQFTFRSLRLGEYTHMCMEALGTIGWIIIYNKYTNGLRKKYKKNA